MARNRVLSFMSSLSSRDSQRSETPTTSLQPGPQQIRKEPPRQDGYRQRPASPHSGQQHLAAGSRDSSQTRAPRERQQVDRASSRPISMVQTYQPPLMELTHDTLPELQPIFTYLNSHGNKLYQEGYFLKLDDQNSHGKPNTDRTWTECFAQLVGTILSLWDAAELDAAGQDGEVLPKYINLTDASIKMIESLPTRSNDDQPLQNVLSISTAGKNRYLLHFNSHHSLIQWTAGIRLATFEYSSLQEAYTGALIGGKGKSLNNISLIMDRARTKHEDWVRVRFGAGTPWRRCWCVITPPDEKEYQKLQKEFNKKKSAYDRSKPPVLKGDVKFYETKKTKKMQPIAQITHAYSAFAIYPQSKPLIDASTLVKLEGVITTYSNPPGSMEGFVFVMPEVHPAVTGFEMMLRWLFPVWDTFALYGRPNRLLADTVNPNSLMFAMPRERRYGYLEILDVSGLILTDGSQNWTEMEWRRNLKDLTARRMNAVGSGSRSGSRVGSRRSHRNSIAGPSHPRVEFNDGSSVKSNPSASWAQGPPTDVPYGERARNDSAPAVADTFQTVSQPATPQHNRSVSDSYGMDRLQNQGLGGYDGGYESGPTPPPHGVGYSAPHQGSGLRYEQDVIGSPEQASFDDNRPAKSTPVRELQELQINRTPEPVARPPAFSHAPGSLPAAKPYQSPELRRAKSRMSNATLAQMAGASGMAAGAGMAVTYASGAEQTRMGEEQRAQNMGSYLEDRDQRGVLSNVNPSGINANPNGLTEGLVTARTKRLSFEYEAPPPATTPPVDEHQLPYSNTNFQQYPSQLLPQYLNQNTPIDAIRPPSPDRNIPDPPKHHSSAYLNRESITHPQIALSPPTIDQMAPSYEQNHDHSLTSSAELGRLQLSQLQTRHSILRKPLPAQSALESPERPPIQSASSSGSIDRVIDQAAFDQIVPRDGPNREMLAPQPPIHSQGSTASLYEDASSNVPSGHASRRPSTESRGSFDKPRAGVMRTVGSAEMEQPRELLLAKQLGSEIPKFDFGPTMNYASNLPSKPSLPRKPSPARKESPSRSTGQGSRNVVTPEPAHRRNDSESSISSRTVPWQPGMASGHTSASVKQAITPEQFVQQRAAAATTPLYAHQRQPSSNLMRSGTPTPPPARHQSGEFGSHSRNNSNELLQRPNSRGSSAALGMSGFGQYSPQPPVKEQEYVNRASGASYSNTAVADSRGMTTSPGLIGAIDAREREKREIRQGLNSQAAQQAMVQRQQQAQVQQQAQRQAQPMVHPTHQNQQAKQNTQPQAQQRASQQYSQQYGMQTATPQAQYVAVEQFQNRQNLPQYPPQPVGQLPYTSPAASVFAQGGGWDSPQQRAPQERGDQQYFQTQQGRGRGR